MILEKALHRKIISVSVVIAFIALAGIVTSYKIPDEGLITSCYVILGFSFISIITSFAIKFKETKWLRRTTRYSVFLLPFLIIIFLIAEYYFNIELNNDAAIIFPSIILFLFALIALAQIYLYTDAAALTGNIVFIMLIIVGIFFKRNHWPLAGWIITFGSAILSIGNFMYGIRCLFLTQKITYLKNVSFSGCCILSIAFLGQLFKLQHWAGAGVLVMVGFVSLIVGTLYILLTLHSSGIIDWQPFHKKILIRILLPWVFIFILYISRYMIPELNRLIWTPNIDKKVDQYGFGMSDYTIDNQNGLNPK
jgi:hypothetical protein